MKKVISLFLTLLVMVSVVGVLVLADETSSQTITVSSEGKGLDQDVLFSNGYRGFCLDRTKKGTSTGEAFEDAGDTSAAVSTNGDDISQKLKILFTQCFEDIFDKDNNGNYYIKDTNTVLGVVAGFSNGQYVWGDQLTLTNKVNAYNGPSIPDVGYTRKIGEEIITFYFTVLLSGNDDIQDFFAYKLEVTPAPSNPIQPTSLKFTATKSLDGRDLKNEEFTFELKDADGEVLQTKQNDANGNITFDELTFDVIDEYSYTVNEKIPSNAGSSGIIYDEREYQIKVVISDENNDGTLEKKTTVNGNEVSEGQDNTVVIGNFANTYVAKPIDVSINGNKVFKNHDMKQFSFAIEAITEGAPIPQNTTVQNDIEDGAFAFENIRFSKVGTYDYKVSEVIPADAKENVKEGIAYDTTVYNVKVVVSDDKNGQLKAKIFVNDKENESIIFTNEYTALPAKVNLTATKKLVNRNLQSGEFTFELRDSKNTVIDTKTNDINGNVKFKELIYDEVGTFEYKVSEVLPSDDNLIKEGIQKDKVTYDSAVYNVKVVVTDNGNGQLIAETTVDGQSSKAISFINEYVPDDVTFTIEGTKKLSGRNMKAEEFSFVLVDADGTVIETVENDMEGKFVFTKFSYDEAGTYEYTVKEVIPEGATAENNYTLNGIIYDTTVYKVTVDVTYDSSKGEFSKIVTYVANDEAVTDVVFKNHYTATPATVKISGTKKGDNLEEKEFEFILRNGDETVETVSRIGAGPIAFKELIFDKVGTYEYSVREVIPEDAVDNVKDGVTYDATVYTVTIEVEDNQEGQLEAEVKVDGESDKAIVFTNYYGVEPVEVEIRGTKAGKNLDDRKFEFALKKGEEEIKKATVTGTGQFVFEKLTFTQAGTYEYTVSEVIPEGAVNNIKDGVTYDLTEYDVVIKVTDNGNGQLLAEVKVDGQTDKDIIFTNNYNATPATVQISGTKAGENLGKKEFKFALQQGSATVETVQTLGKGTFEFAPLTFTQAGTYEYTVKEVLPEGATAENNYTINEIKYDTTEYKVIIEVTDNEKGQLVATVNIAGTSDNTIVFTNEYVPEKTEATVKKVWDDANNQDGKRPAELKVALSNGTEVTLNADNGWTATVKDLPKNANGTEIVYTWTEDLPDGYLLAGEVTEGTVTTLTNTYNPEKTSVPVRKIWDDADNQDGLRPKTVTVKLLAAGTDTGKTLVLSEANNWTAIFTELDKYADGTEIVYTVKEAEKISEYTTTITGDAQTGYIITNTHTPETISIRGTKSWDDNDNQDGLRPEKITVNLLADGTVVDSQVVTAESDWEYEFTNLPKYKAGKAIVYTITEAEVDGYTTVITGDAENGFVITNTHTPTDEPGTPDNPDTPDKPDCPDCPDKPETVSVTVKKIWNDCNNKYGKRPANLTVVLSNGIIVKLNAKNNWTATVDNLPKYKDGKEIVYTWMEGFMPEGYILTDVKIFDKTTVLTNTYIPPMPEPDKPDVPDKPDCPDVPDEPDVPDVPDVPDEPDVPDTPTPDNPDEPGGTDTPTPDDPEGEEPGDDPIIIVPPEDGEEDDNDDKPVISEPSGNEDTDGAPETGDINNAGVNFAVFAGAFLTIVGTIRYRRKRR